MTAEVVIMSDFVIERARGTIGAPPDSPAEAKRRAAHAAAIALETYGYRRPGAGPSTSRVGYRSAGSCAAYTPDGGLGGCHFRRSWGPTVAPDVRAPDDYQNIQAKAGAGLEAVGAGLGKVSQFWGQVQTDGAVNNAMDKVNANPRPL